MLFQEKLAAAAALGTISTSSSTIKVAAPLFFELFDTSNSISIESGGFETEVADGFRLLASLFRSLTIKHFIAEVRSEPTRARVEGYAVVGAIKYSINFWIPVSGVIVEV